MKVLHINTSDSFGGAAKACHRLHQELLKNGVDSSILVIYKSLNESQIRCIRKSFISKVFNSIIPRLNNFSDRKALKNNVTWSTNRFSTGRTIGLIKKINPDIIHLHWIGNSMLSIRELKRINKPIVWTFHDSWAFTGGCHIPTPCDAYTRNCGNCPILKSRKNQDISFKTLKNKLLYWKNIQFNIIAPSRWMAECTRHSTLFKSSFVTNIPVGLDLDLFKPAPENLSRSMINLPLNVKIVLFGAVGITEDKNKGFHLLCESFQKLETKDEYLVVIFGGGNPHNINKMNVPVKFLGTINDEFELTMLYSSADVMIVPSLVENLPQTAIESMACGTPVVAFNTTGITDIVDHKINGYLAKPYDTEDLAQGIKWVLEHSDYETLSVNARNKAIDRFNITDICAQHMLYYKSILKIKD